MILKSAAASAADVLPFRNVTPKAAERFVTCVPLTSLRAAAGRFSEEQVGFDELAGWASEWITWDDHPRFEPGMFVAKVQGRSMEPEIPDGAYCLFRPPRAGSREGRRLLVWHSGIDDPMTSGHYTLKVYTSEKAPTSDGSWQHTKVVLKPLNPEFDPIVLTPKDEGDVGVIAELAAVLTTKASAMKFRERGFDHLGNLGSRLADLQGYATLAHELIQNADDVGNSGFLKFDIRSDALVVDNGGLFRSCGQLEAYDCPWLEDSQRDPGLRRRCDFHRFAWIGAGDKRSEENTTGAFGLGFLTVYQITDAPELISAGQHWILDEVADEKHRIRICEGCARCASDDRPGTRFILPWAFNPESPLRRALRAQAVASDVRAELPSALRELLPGSMLFLRSLESIQLAVDGTTNPRVTQA